MVEVSLELKVKVKLNDIPAYRLAQKAGLDPSTLSKLLCGIVRIKPNDPRVIAIGKVLGLEPEECFEQVVLEGKDK